MLKFYNISERFKQEINESKYKRWILENKGMLLISILIAIFLTILTYPGIMYSDSYARIGVTSELKTAIHAFNVGNVSMTNLASWLTITPSFFILLSEQIVGSVVLYTFVQCFLLFLIIFSLSADLCFRNKILKKIMICLLPILAIVSFCGTYGEYTKVGDNIVKNITKEGTLLCENGKNYVYYLDGKLYFVNLPGADEIYTYFLHYFPLDGDMINSDFKYELIKIATSFWKNSVAVMDMPKQEVEKIEFGQYYGDTRFWERTIETSSFISRPKMLYLSDYTDNDWNCGYSNLENCFLINNLDLENYYIKGKELQLQDGSVTRITDVEEVAGYIRIYTDEKLDDVSVREYQVIE